MQQAEDDVAKLLAQHAAPITVLLQRFIAYKTIDIGTAFDELFALRFLLSSNMDLEQASKKMDECLKWRHANLSRLGTVPHKEVFAKYMKRGVCGWLNNQYLLFVIRAGQADSSGLCKALNHEELRDSMLFSYEVNFQSVDRKTRETGKICKVISILDLQGFSMFRFDKRFSKTNGEVSHLSTVMYPQLLQMLVVINLPSVFKVLFGLAQVFMSKETLAKIKLCRASNSTKQSAAQCPYLQKYGLEALDAIPEFLGGKMAVTPELRFD